MNAPLWVAAPVFVIVGVATWADVRTRKIPNRLTGAALLTGFLAQLALTGPKGLLIAAIGMLAAGAVFLPGWLLGFMGAGDVKLMAAVGAWLGFPGALLAALSALVAGGVIALIVAAKRGLLMQSIRRASLLGFHLAARTGLAPSVPTSGVRFPFAPAVLVGAAFVLWRQS